MVFFFPQRTSSRRCKCQLPWLLSYRVVVLLCGEIMKHHLDKQGCICVWDTTFCISWLLWKWSYSSLLPQVFMQAGWVTLVSSKSLWIASPLMCGITLVLPWRKSANSHSASGSFELIFGHLMSLSRKDFCMMNRFPYLSCKTFHGPLYAFSES